MKFFKNPRINCILLSGIIYLSYYLCRYNISVAKIGMGQEFSIDKREIGVILSFFTLTYAIGQVFFGYLADRVKARRILLFGILGSLSMNILLFFTNAFWLIGLIWAVNGFFQASGWSPISRTIGNILPKNKRAVGFGIWGISYQTGGALAIILAGYLLSRLSWRYAFLIPGLILIIPLIMTLFYNYDYPEKKNSEHNTLLSPFRNISVLLLFFSYFALGFIRYSFINWGIDYQMEQNRMSLTSSFISLAVFPFTGIAGVLFSGLISDRLMKSKRAVLSFAMMSGLTCLIIAFFNVRGNFQYLSAALLGLIGIFIAACDSFIGTTATYEFSKIREEGQSIGLADSFMYIGAIFSGFLNGLLIHYSGWETAKIIWVITAAAGAAILLPLIKKEKHYENQIVY